MYQCPARPAAPKKQPGRSAKEYTPKTPQRTVTRYHPRVRTSPPGASGAAVEFSYWDKTRDVRVKVNLRKFELGCLGLLGLTLLLWLFGDRLTIQDVET